MRAIYVIGLVWMSALAGCRDKTQRLEEVPSATSTDEKDWQDAAPGVSYRFMNAEEPKNRVHIIRADLRHPQVAVFATRHEDKKHAVSQFAATYQCSAAVNADLFNGSFTPLGLATGGGQAWEGTKDNERSAFFAFGLDNKVATSIGAEVKTQEPWMYSVVSGFPMMVQDGKSGDVTCKCNASFYQSRHPRTAIGISQDQRYLFLVAVDGRREDSKGLTMQELADLMISIGAHMALNLDGGGSTAMYVRNLGGIVNKPSDGKERIVANHIGICSGATADQEALKAARPDFIPAPAPAGEEAAEATNFSEPPFQDEARP